jgi:hypothetical protein
MVLSSFPVMNFLENGQWLINRLQAMETAEIFSRLAHLGRHVALRMSRDNIKGRPLSKAGAVHLSFQVPECKAQLSRISTEEQQNIISAANEWLRDRASFFSLKHVALGDPIDWHRDYSSGIVAPIRYSGLINSRQKGKIGDIKYIWELNRLQHLLLLALAAGWTGNTNYGEKIEKQALSWDKSNPFMMGLNWKSPLEAGMRLITWAYVSFVMGNLIQSRSRFPEDLQNTIYQHQYFIRKFYSKNSSANNHVIGEMAGLYIASVVWPWYRESVSWRSFSKQKLIEEIYRQIEPDGVGKERATEYQLFALEFFIAAGALGQAVGDPFPQEYWDRIDRMMAFLSMISNRQGDAPMFGDGDNAQVVFLPEPRVERVRGLAKIGQWHEGKGTPALRSVLLLWGQTPDDIPLGRRLSPKRQAQLFPNGGYHILDTDRDGENEIVTVFDVAPLGLPPLHAHGHADALSFWYSYGGKEFLIDPGTYCYHTSERWRSYFRGTAAHNTIRIDGEDQSVAGGTFLWRKAAECWLEQTEDTDTFIGVTGSHDGYGRLQDPVIHKRSLRLFKNARRLLINDALDCAGDHELEVFFHFSEQCQVRQVTPRSYEASNGNRRIVICLDSRLKPQLYRACENPILGWLSRSFGTKEPSFSLVARGTISGFTELRTEITAL